MHEMTQTKETVPKGRLTGCSREHGVQRSARILCRASATVLRDKISFSSTPITLCMQSVQIRQKILPVEVAPLNRVIPRMDGTSSR